MVSVVGLFNAYLWSDGKRKAKAGRHLLAKLEPGRLTGAKSCLVWALGVVDQSCRVSEGSEVCSGEGGIGTSLGS